VVTTGIRARGQIALLMSRLQAVLTRMPLQTRPVTQRRSRGARYNGLDHTWASEQVEVVPRGDVTAGLRLVLDEAKGVPARFVFAKPATAAKGDERRVASLPSPQQLRRALRRATIHFNFRLFKV
jgi:hypothetical protein